MITALMVAGWVLCSVVAYGLCYHDFQTKIVGSHRTLELMGEKWCRSRGRAPASIIAIMGPMGLLSGLIAGWPYGLRYRYRGPTK